MYSEDDTFRKLSRPGFAEMSALYMENLRDNSWDRGSSAQLFKDNGWTISEFLEIYKRLNQLNYGIDSGS